MSVPALIASTAASPDEYLSVIAPMAIESDIIIPSKLRSPLSLPSIIS